jgi:hypothetical protein
VTPRLVAVNVVHELSMVQLAIPSVLRTPDHERPYFVRHTIGTRTVSAENAPQYES